jgi:hypothetical protein
VTVQKRVDALSGYSKGVSDLGNAHQIELHSFEQ